VGVQPPNPSVASPLAQIFFGSDQTDMASFDLQRNSRKSDKILRLIKLFVMDD
jgi:hypothetical protein